MELCSLDKKFLNVDTDQSKHVMELIKILAGNVPDARVDSSMAAKAKCHSSSDENEDDDDEDDNEDAEKYQNIFCLFGLVLGYLVKLLFGSKLVWITLTSPV